MVWTGDGELGFDSEERARETATTSEEGSGKLPNRHGRMFSLIKNESWGLKTIDTVPSLNHKRCRPGITDVAFRTPLAPYEKSKFLGSGGSMVARLKLKGIDGRAPPRVEPSA
ncbi:hypothetical protein AAG906_008552 [Vitis piasezkii]